MDEALSLAAKGAGRTSPNPMVGAVVVDLRGEVAGRGWHARAGEPHAEIHALGEAGDRTRGASLYVTLEPCAHQGRTPPCTGAIREAGIRRVVAAVEDPNPKVSGGGVRLLREAGLSVEVGLRAREAVRLNEAFFSWARTGRPFVTLKVAASLDGRIATRSGESRWITGEASRARGHGVRDRVDAILVGVKTVLKDDPILTARPYGKEGKPLIRIVLDSHLLTPLEARLLRPDRGVATILATTQDPSGDAAAPLREAGAEIFCFPPDREGRVPIGELLSALGGRGVTHLLVEGGGRVHGSFIGEDFADKMLYFLAPMIIGDSEAPHAVSGMNIPSLPEASRLREVRSETLGEDLLVEGYLKPPLWADYPEC